MKKALLILLLALFAACAQSVGSHKLGAVQQFANNARSSLAANITSGATTLSVVSASGFPAVPQFDISLGGTELALVIGVAGGTFTVIRGVEGTTPVAHVAGESVTQIVTAGGLAAAITQGHAVVFQPGGTASSNVMTAWADVATAIASANGAITVYVDGTFTAAHVPASSGITNCLGRVQLSSANLLNPENTTLTVDDGATLKDLYMLRGGLVLLGDTKSTTPAVNWTFPASPGQTGFYIREGAILGTTTTATHAAVQITAGEGLYIDLDDEAVIFPQGSQPVVDISGASANLQIISRFSFLIPNALSGAASGTVLVNYDASSLALWFQDGFGFPTQPSFAGSLTFTPAWVLAPTTVTSTGGTTTLSTVTQQLEVGGALASNSTITIPTQNGLQVSVVNKTSGAHTVTVQTSGGGFSVAQGKSATGYINSSGVFVRLTPDT